MSTTSPLLRSSSASATSPTSSISSPSTVTITSPTLTPALPAGVSVSTPCTSKPESSGAPKKRRSSGVMLLTCTPSRPLPNENEKLMPGGAAGGTGGANAIASTGGIGASGGAGGSGARGGRASARVGSAK